MFVDVYRIINGLYRTNDLVEQIEFKDPLFQVELLEFCNRHNVMISDKNEDVLVCRDTKQPKYFIK